MSLRRQLGLTRLFFLIGMIVLIVSAVVAAQAPVGLDRNLQDPIGWIGMTIGSLILMIAVCKQYLLKQDIKRAEGGEVPHTETAEMPARDTSRNLRAIKPQRGASNA
ncbi:MAG TPA: hypothetical protein VNA68_00800 [Candidatus Dormibacteraeota bacterium]|nr:hypothetical protein [Candidatus Dormibacteraeota bacterium]